MRQCSLDRSVTDQHRRVHCTDSELLSGRIFSRCRYAPRMARDVAKPMRAGNKTVTIREDAIEVQNPNSGNEINSTDGVGAAALTILKFGTKMTVLFIINLLNHKTVK
ncbi:hypothetical protein EVAR_12578_1 [Eumeta japonica]|uniref:Uncharacterized protein n=1 Tax=Eumeta variegata TaxID=151549 RepID=A0A4C1UG69_EUMVA|nr:hypothetical protein EVAR_12578_1 [Eumeta japonica]